MVINGQAVINGQGAVNSGRVINGIEQGGSPPDAPTLLTAVQNGTGQIDLAWTDNSGNEDGFSIERSDGDNLNFVEIDTVAADDTTYSDTSLASGVYYYRVMAYNGLGDSAYSNEANATAYNLLENLTAYWKMDEVSDGSVTIPRTDSIATYDLADPNKRLSAAAKLDLGVDLTDATNRLDDSDAIYHIAGTPCEFAFWIKPTAANSDRLIISKGGGASPDYYVAITTGTPGSIVWRIFGMSSTTVTLSMNIAAGSWYCVHCWWNGSNQYGIRVNDASANQSAALTGTPTSVGTAIEVGGARYSRFAAICILDDVKFYKGRVLSAAERTAIYNGGNGYDFFP